VENNINAQNSQNLSSLNSNPQLPQSIIEFETGELKHTIDRCEVCFETRPVFNITESLNRNKDDSKPVSQKPWKVTKGCCERCLKDRKTRKNQRAAKFSGLHSSDTDMGPSHNNLRTNNMHFEIVPL
jgi:hypothetical protein